MIRKLTTICLSLILGLTVQGKVTKNDKIGKNMTVEIIPGDNFSEEVKSIVKRYEISMLLLTQEEMNLKFDGSEIEGQTNDQDLFCLMRVRIKDKKNYIHIRHSAELNMLDEDFKKAGMNEPIYINDYSEDDCTFLIFRLSLHQDNKALILNKKSIKIRMDKMWNK